jgi:hypothetical protein
VVDAVHLVALAFQVLWRDTREERFGGSAVSIRSCPHQEN